MMKLQKKLQTKKKPEIYNKNKEKFYELNNDGEKFIVCKITLTNFLKLIGILR